MKRFISLAIAALMMFSLALPVMATEGEATDGSAAVASTAPVTGTEGETVGTEGEEAQTQAAPIFSGSKRTVKVPGSAVSFTMPSELKFVTFASPESELSALGITRASFVANSYVFFAYNDDNSYPVYFQMTRSKDEYAAYIKDFKRLSKAERQAMVDDALSVVQMDQYTYTQGNAYSDAEFVKLAGMQCLKTTSADGTTVVLTSVKNGYTYEITYSYDSGLSESDIKAVEDMVNSLKVANPIDVNTVLLYVALALIVLLIAGFVMLYLRFTALNSIIADVFSECECDECCEYEECEECECDQCDSQEDEEQMSFDDSDFAEPYSVSDSEENEEVEESEESEEDAE